MLKVAIAGVVLFVLGAVAFVVHHENAKVHPPRSPAVDENESIVTIANGERVDLDAHIASKGFTVVEFTADF